MVEQYNDQLRELRLHDLADVSNTLRETIRELRDEERAPQDAVQVHTSHLIDKISMCAIPESVLEQDAISKLSASSKWLVKRSPRIYCLVRDHSNQIC